MNLLLISATILLAGIAVWLWHLSTAQMADLSLKALLVPVQNVTMLPIPKYKYKKVIEIITHPYTVLVACILGAVGIVMGMVYLLKKFPQLVFILLIIITILIIICTITLVKYGLMQHAKTLNKSYYEVGTLRRYEPYIWQAIIEEENINARQLFNERKYTDAVAKWEYILELDPKNLKAINGIEKYNKLLKDINTLNDSAQRLYDEGVYNEATNKWIEVLKLDPGNNRAADKIKKWIIYSGEAMLPKKVYVGDSNSISINLKRTSSTSSDEKSLNTQDSRSGKLIELQIQRDSGLEQFLEVQLLAAGLVIDGEKIQRKSLNLPTLSYNWNCYFPNSGDHLISLIIRVVSQSDTIELGSIQHSIKVAQLDHLTQRQTQLAGIISGVLGIPVLLQQLDVLQKIASIWR